MLLAIALLLLAFTQSRGCRSKTKHGNDFQQEAIGHYRTIGFTPPNDQREVTSFQESPELGPSPGGQRNVITFNAAISAAEKAQDRMTAPAKVVKIAGPRHVQTIERL